jgi:hypothetical protein
MRIFETITAIFPFASLNQGECAGLVCLQSITKGADVGFNTYKWLFPRKPKNPI